MFKSVPSRTKWQKGEGGREPGRSSLGNERKEEQQERRAEGLGYGVKCETRRQQWRINQQQAEAPWPLRPCTASFWVNMKGENMRERESENLLFLELCNNISILEVMLYRKRTDKKNKNRGGGCGKKAERDKWMQRNPDLHSEVDRPCRSGNGTSLADLSSAGVTSHRLFWGLINASFRPLCLITALPVEEVITCRIQSQQKP